MRSQRQGVLHNVRCRRQPAWLRLGRQCARSARPDLLVIHHWSSHVALRHLHIHFASCCLCLARSCRDCGRQVVEPAMVRATPESNDDTGLLIVATAPHDFTTLSKRFVPPAPENYLTHAQAMQTIPQIRSGDKSRFSAGLRHNVRRLIFSATPSADPLMKRASWTVACHRTPLGNSLGFLPRRQGKCSARCFVEGLHAQPETTETHQKISDRS